LLTGALVQGQEARAMQLTDGVKVLVLQGKKTFLKQKALIEKL